MSNLPSLEDKGLVEVFEYKTNDKGEEIKIRKIIRRYVSRTRINDITKARKDNWVKFGAAAVDNTNTTFLSHEEIFMEPPNQPEEKEPETPQIPSFSTTTTATVSCHFCGGKHWSRFCDRDQKEKHVEPLVEKKKYDASKSIQILNLSKEIKEYELYDFIIGFSKKAKISRLYIPKDMHTGESRGVAFVTFGTKEQAEDAVYNIDNKGINHLLIKASLINH